MSKVSLASQIAAINSVTSGKVAVVALSHSQRDLLLDHLRAAALTLHFVMQNETAIRAFVEARKGSRP